MKAHSLFSKTAAGVGSLALAFAMTACSHHSSMAEQAGQNTGEIRTEAATTQSSSGEVLGTAPAPANTQGTVSNPGTPAIISGPAAVDNSGRVYTSSSVGSAGNASSVGTNTNVNIVPNSSNGSTTLVTETPAPAPVVVETPAPAPIVVETPAPAPAPVVVETPAPAPVVVETPAPMTSSTTTVTQTRHRRLRKD
jgi:hypothetical protein